MKNGDRRNSAARQVVEIRPWPFEEYLPTIF